MKRGVTLVELIVVIAIIAIIAACIIPILGGTRHRVIHPVPITATQ